MRKIATLSAAIILYATAASAMGWLPFGQKGDAGEDMHAARAAQYADMRKSLCPPPADTAATPAAPPDEASLAVEPFKIFDNFYFIGSKAASAWALTTSDGIILIEAMFYDNVRQTVEAGLKKLGLDPASIKYVIVAHGHNDHWGGAQYLRDTYGARIVMSKLDWDYIQTHKQLGKEAPLPKRDIQAKDGDVITLGDTSVQLVLTPGHSPGTFSPIFAVKDGDETHYVGYWGGPAMSYLDPEGLKAYMRSAEMFRNLDPRIDVEVTNHAFADGTFAKRDVLAARKPGEPHPFVVGNTAFKKWMDVFHDCAAEILASKESTQ